jgi:hypothetical protein
VLVTTTLLPAILGGIGPRIDWPRLRHEHTASRPWSAWGRLVVRYRAFRSVLLPAKAVAFLFRLLPRPLAKIFPAQPAGIPDQPPPARRPRTKCPLAHRPGIESKLAANDLRLSVRSLAA